MGMLVSLMDALVAAVGAGGAVTPRLLHSATHKGGKAELSRGAFLLGEWRGVYLMPSGFVKCKNDIDDYKAM